MRDNITVKTSCPARKIERRGEGFSVLTDDGKINADFVIVSCGGAAGAKVGGVHDGYELLKLLGHKSTVLLPSLVQLVTDPNYPRALKGVRVMASCALKRTEIIAGSSGELQLTETGLSGPAAFDISRAAAQTGKGKVHIDLSGNEDIETKLRARIKANPSLCADDALTGVLHNRLGRMVVKYAGVPGQTPLERLEQQQIAAIAAACRDFCHRAARRGGF
ncbi:MAG: NAD(P)/FAD-dependent oxidoreductase [Oscillospiraceae bacterium]